MKCEVYPHDFPGWKEAYQYCKAADAAVLARVGTEIAVICMDGTYLEIDGIEGLDHVKETLHAQ